MARWAPALRLTKLVSSPFLRTLQTTDYVQREVGLTPEIWVDLHEQGGCVSGATPETMVGRPGMTREAIAQQFPDFDDTSMVSGIGWWQSRPYETQAEAEVRARLLLEKVLSLFAGTDQRVAFITHGDFARRVLECFHDTPLDVPHNTSVSEVHVALDRTRLANYDGTDHLSEELKSR